MFLRNTIFLRKTNMCRVTDRPHPRGEIVIGGQAVAKVRKVGYLSVIRNKQCFGSVFIENPDPDLCILLNMDPDPACC